MKSIINFKFKNVLKILLIPFIVILSLCLYKQKQKPIFIFNYTSVIIVSPSMEPEYLTNSFLIIKKESFENLKVGDVIAFRADALKGKLAFHRIIRIDKEGVVTKGDNNNFEDTQLITENNYVGKKYFHTNIPSHYLRLIKSTIGFILFLITPLLMIILIYFLIKLKRKTYEEKI